MKQFKLMLCAVAFAICSPVHAQATYAESHGALIAGESNSIANGGAKVFYPASVGGTLVSATGGSFVKSAEVKAGTTNAGLAVRSSLVNAPRDKNSWLYVDATGKAYLSNYNLYGANATYATSILERPVLLDPSKYPELSTATKVFSTYLGSSDNTSFYLSGSNLYRTNALKVGAANSSAATLVNGNVLGAVGVDAGVFIRTSAGVTFLGADGSEVGLSAIINGSLTDAEFKSIVAVHAKYYVMVMENGNHLLFKSDGTYSKQVSGFDRAGFIPYYSRSSQVAGHNGQTTFAWFDADYSINYIDPYGTEANAIQNINWVGIGGTKLVRSNIIKVLSVSEDGFVQYTGKNAANTTAYLQIAGSFSKLASIVSLSSTTMTEPATSSAASIAWNNPSNASWHYKVPPATFGNSGAKTYYWKWGTSAGKTTFTRSSGTVQVQEYGGGGRFCKQSTSNIGVSNLATQTGSGTTTISGPSNTCGGATLTASQADAASGINGLVAVGASDFSYLNGSGAFSKSTSYLDLSSAGAPATVSGTLSTPGAFTGSSGWDGKHSMLFALSNDGGAFVGGEMFSPGVGTSVLVPLPLVKPLIANSTGEISTNSATITWADPRDPRVGATQWNVTTSRWLNNSAVDSATVAGEVGTRQISWNPVTDGYEQTFKAEASIVVPGIGHRGAVITVQANNFTGSVARAPTIGVPPNNVVSSNSLENEIPVTITDPDVGDELTKTIAIQPLHGLASIVDGKFYYKPNLNYAGTDSFSIQVQDKYGLVSSAGVAINVQCAEPTVGVLTLTKRINGPYRGTDAILNYSANSCNGPVTADFKVKDSEGNTIESQSGMFTLTHGDSQTKAFTFNDLAPGYYAISVNVKSAVNTTFDRTLTASGGYKSDPIAPARVALSKASPTEDDQVTATVLDLDNCVLYDTVSGARINKGCYVEWAKSPGVHTLTPLNASSAKFGALRGSQTVSATVKAYNVDGTNTAMLPVSQTFNVGAAVDVDVDLSFSKTGSFRRIGDKVGVTVSGKATNLCQVSATNDQALAIAESGTNACVLEFTSLPEGIVQIAGQLQLEGRVTNVASNRVDYSIYRLVSAGNRFLINSGNFVIPVIDSSYSSSMSVSQLDVNGQNGYKSKVVVNGSVATSPASDLNDAKTSWAGAGSPKYLIEWLSNPIGISPSYLEGENVLSGVPTSEGDQTGSYRVYFVDPSDTQYQVSTGSGVFERAPLINTPSQAIDVGTGSQYVDISGVSASDPDLGDVTTISIDSQAAVGQARIDAGKVQYMPNSSVVGADQFKLRATDKFGAYRIGTVNVNVLCTLPTTGTVKKPGDGAFMAGKSVSLQAQYGPVHACHGGFQAKLEVVDTSTGQIAKSVPVPSSNPTTLDGNGLPVNNPIFAGVVLPQGTYSTRVVVTSNADSSKIATFNGDTLSVFAPVAPTLAISKINPTEDDDVVVSASAVNGCVYYPTVAEARTNEGCHIDWSFGSGVKSVKRQSESSVQIASLQGSQLIQASVKSYNSDGTYFSLPDANTQLVFADGVEMALTPTFSQGGSYRQYLDSVGINVALGAGNCVIQRDVAQAQASLNAGNHACVVEYTSLPSGLSQHPNDLSISGRIANLDTANVSYRISRLYAEGELHLMNSGSFPVPLAPFVADVTTAMSPTTVQGKAGYSLGVAVGKDAWSCVQTDSAANAISTWTSSGTPSCLVEWTDIKDGFTVVNQGGEVKVVGAPADQGDQTASYAVSFVKEDGTRVFVGSGTNKLVDRAPTIAAPGLVRLNPNSEAKAIDGLTVADDDVGDVAIASISQPASHGTALNNNGIITYQPEYGYIGSDTFTLRATDKFGAFTTRDVSVLVSCPMPNRGSVAVVGGSTKLNARPVDFVASYSPKDACNFGYTTSFQVINSDTGAVVQQINVPTSVQDGLDPMGGEESSLTFQDISFPPGSYTSKLIVTSNAFPTNAYEVVGASFVVNNFAAPTLSANTATPTEDDVVTVAVNHASCGSFVPTVDAVRTTENSCYVEWSKGGTATTITRDAPNTVLVTGDRGVGTVTATLKIADSSGVVQTVSTGQLAMTYRPGNATPALSPVFNKSSFAAIRDVVTGGLSVQSGGLQCTLVRTVAEGADAATRGEKACMVTFTKLPEGIVASTTGVGFRGRFMRESDKTFEYSVARVFSDSTVFDLPVGSFDAALTPFGVDATIQTSKPAYVAGAEDALVSLRLNNAGGSSTACVQTGSASEAAASWSGNGTPRCLVTWTTIPAGMQVDTTLGLTLTGKPTTPTSTAVGYKVEFVDDLGAKHLALSGSQSIAVMESISPSFSLVSRNGYWVADGNSDKHYLIGDDGVIGSATFTGAPFSPMTVSVLDGLTGNYTTTDENVASGGHVNLVVSTSPGNAWSSRNATMFMAYAGHGDLLAKVETLGLMKMPPANVVARVIAPERSLDTSNVSVIVKVGELVGTAVTYDQAKHGLWRVKLAEMVNGVPVPFTGELDLSNNDGTVIFDGVSGTSIDGKTIAAVAVPYVIGGTLHDVTYKVVSPGVPISFLPGGPIPATITASRTSGSIPFGVRFDLVVDSQYRDDIKSISYEYSLNDGGWILMSGLRSMSGTYTFQDGGVYKVRAVITNKNSLVISQTSPVVLTVKQALKMNVSPNAMALPGTNVDVTLSATKPDGSAVSYVSEWEIFRQGEANQTTSNVNKITLNSASPQVVNVKVKARPTELPADDPESWVSVTRSVIFAVPDKPRAAINGPATIEAGVPQEFSVKIFPSWPTGTNTTMQLSGKWILPNGTEIPGTGPITWAPTPAEILSGGELLKLNYVAWVVGAETDTSVTVDKKVYIRKYEFPKFKLAVKADTTYAPSFVTLVVQPETANDAKLMLGKKFTYEWTVPDGILGKGSATKYAGTIDMPGTYEISVRISDERGSDQTLSYSYDIVESRPYGMTMKATLAQKFNRAPVKYGLKVEVLGGHPKDRIKSFKTYVNSEMVLDSGVRKPTLVTLNQAGEATIKVTMESTFGALIEASQVVTVDVNTLPTCTLTDTWDSRGRYVAVKSACKDPDGLIRKYTWFVDGVEQPKTSTSLVWVPTETKTSATVKLVVTDDSGATSEASISVTKP